MPCFNYVQCLKTSGFYASFRQEAISLIFQAQYSCNLDPYTRCLAVTYMDRFISRRDIPVKRTYLYHFYGIAIVLFTLHVNETQRAEGFVFDSYGIAIVLFTLHVNETQRAEGFVFDASAIRRMELLILNALDWRMRSITPFLFIGLFESLFELKDPPLAQALKDRAIHIIFQAHDEIDLLEFKPSIIAASGFLVATHELFPLQFPSFETSITSCEYVNKVNVLKCFNAMLEMAINETSELIVDTMSSSGTRTPVSVSDCHSTKSEIESTTTTMVAAIATVPEKKDMKCSHKLIGFCSESKRVKISQIEPCG
ncbi:hypothetical protein V6N11_021491 [Hibiscus sabdariffa]